MRKCEQIFGERLFNLVARPTFYRNMFFYIYTFTTLQVVVSLKFFSMYSIHSVMKERKKLILAKESDIDKASMLKL